MLLLQCCPLKNCRPKSRLRSSKCMTSHTQQFSLKTRRPLGVVWWLDLCVCVCAERRRKERQSSPCLYLQYLSDCSKGVWQHGWYSDSSRLFRTSHVSKLLSCLIPSSPEKTTVVGGAPARKLLLYFQFWLEHQTWRGGLKTLRDVSKRGEHELCEKRPLLMWYYWVSGLHKRAEVPERTYIQ